MFLLKLRNRHFFLIDTLILLVTPTLALMLRLDTVDISRSFWAGLAIFTIQALIIRLLVFRSFGLYSRYWQYASIEELVQIATAVLVSSALLTILILFLLSIYPTPFARSVIIIDALLVLIAVGLTRFSVRFLSHHQNIHLPDGSRVLIMGAGDAGNMIARELRQQPQTGLYPVAFVDDDANKQGLRIQGLPVMGGRKDIPRLVTRHKIDMVILAMPSAPGDVIREVVGACELIGVKTKSVPGLHEIMEDRIRAQQLRDVNIEDLLRREPVKTDIQAVRALIAGKRVLITGGGGSIGSELCRQLLYCGPSELIFLGHGENSVFEIFHELRSAGVQGPRLTPLIADVRFGDRIHNLFQQFRPEIVFHAAAHKHVPLMERNPSEAITNNVLGTQNLLKAALAAGVERFVMISTDKAVNPTSIMGASKRTAELLVHQAAQKSGRPYVAVRFGNVLGSRGSVVLTFKRQIAQGGPVTVTHPDVKRYFMTIPEAVQLVLQAATLGTGDEVFVLDMGEPVKIVDLAKDLIRLSGYEVGRDIDIQMVGLRPGEKLFEELFLDGENYHRTQHQKIFIAAGAGRSAPHNLDSMINALVRAAERDDKEAIICGLNSLIPEYTPMPAAGENGKKAPINAQRTAALPQPISATS